MTTSQDAAAVAESTASAGAYAQVNGLNMYYEVHDVGRPLVLIHGGVLTIDLCFRSLIPALAAEHQVIAVELQAHGRTADIDREMSVEYLANDVVALLDHLDIDRADFFGFSLGGLTSLQAAVRYPDRVGRLVIASVQYQPGGYYDEIFDSTAWATSRKLPTQDDFRAMQEAYTQVAPNPEHFQASLDKTSAMVAAFQGWKADDLRGITAPTLIVIGDDDFVRPEHAAEMHRLIPDSRLAILPGTTHMGVMRQTDLLLPMLASFLG